MIALKRTNDQMETDGFAMVGIVFALTEESYDTIKASAKRPHH
jgi:hypothetical protein